MSKYNINFERLYNIIQNWTWRELEYGVKKSIISEKDIVGFATKLLSEDLEDFDLVLDLSTAKKDEVKTILFQLASGENEEDVEQMEDKWISGIIYERYLASNEDLYDIIESLYNDFGYPDQLIPLIRFHYMPYEDGISEEERINDYIEKIKCNIKNGKYEPIIWKSIKLNQMSYNNAEKYYKYKRKYLRKDLFIELVLINGVLAIIAVATFMLSESFLHWLIPSILTLVIVIFMCASLEYFKEHRKLLKKASKVSYEYAKVITEFKQPTKFICSDGYVVKWTMEEGDMEKKNGQDAVVIYLRTVDQMYLESVKTFNKIFGKMM